MANENITPAQVTPKAEVPIENKLYPDQKPVETPPVVPPVETKPAEVPPVATPSVEVKPVTDPAAPAKPETKVPEKYELKLPDGSLLDPKLIEEVSSFAKEKGLSNDQAQAILERESNAVKSFATLQQQQHEAQVGKWHEAVKSDKELGGEQFSQTAQFAKDAVAKFGSPEFRKILDETGYGNHPELVRAFARIGKAMGNDTVVRPGAQASGQKRPEDILYPTKSA